MAESPVAAAAGGDRRGTRASRGARSATSSSRRWTVTSACGLVRTHIENGLVHACGRGGLQDFAKDLDRAGAFVRCQPDQRKHGSQTYRQEISMLSFGVLQRGAQHHGGLFGAVLGRGNRGRPECAIVLDLERDGT